MRRTYTFAIAAAAVVAIMALGTKVIVFGPKADATVSQPNAVSIDDLHRNMKDLPVMEIKDPI
jgi:hypothetical protein